MNQILASITKGGRAAVLALALGAASMTPMPVMAQSPSFSFDFGIGGGGENFSFQLGRGGRHIRRDCLTTNEIRRGLRRQGWDDIRFIDRRGNRVQVIAEHRRSTYRLTIHRCTGRVTDIDRVRRDRDRDHRRDRRGPGFGLHFNFGN